MTDQTQTITGGYGDYILDVYANGGSVVVERPVGTFWVTADTFTADGSYVLTLGAGTTRFTASDGALFEVGK